MKILETRHLHSAQTRPLLLLGVVICLILNPACAASESQPRLILIGDSTVRCGRANGVNGLWGWGQVIGAHFDLKRISIENHAMGGTSSRSFQTQGNWEKALERVRPGDYVLMQFGHNDGGEMFIGDRPRASIKGNGEETKEGVVEATGKSETVHSYGWYVRKFIADVRAKEATPIVCSLIPRNRWQDGKVIRAGNDYAKWAEEAAKQGGTAFINLNELVAARYEQFGERHVGEQFFTKTDWTHTTLAGAKLNAECIAQGISQLEEVGLSKYLKPKASLDDSLPIRFAFGPNHRTEGFQNVTAKDIYSREKGYGFEPGADIACEESTAQAGCGSPQPFYFSVALEEGSYRVKLESSGHPPTVKAELRRLMFWQPPEAEASSSAVEFTVNIRTTKIDEKRSVRLKQREKENEFWAWDEKLTLEFNGPEPSVSSLTIAPEPDSLTIFLAGDSTVTDQPSAPWGSWGQMLPYFFQPGVAIANYAQSGESVASSLGAGRFEKIFAEMKPGDHLLIQFGHNDMKSKRPDALSKYRQNLTDIIRRTHDLGGVPVLVTSMERKPGRGYVSLGEYPQAMREVAARIRVPLIDLNKMSRQLYEALDENLGPAFQDNSHHTVYGSFLLAKCVVQGIVDNRLTIAPLVNDRFTGFDPAKPDSLENVAIPATPKVDLLKPDGS